MSVNMLGPTDTNQLLVFFWCILVIRTSSTVCGVGLTKYVTEKSPFTHDQLCVLVKFGKKCVKFGSGSVKFRSGLVKFGSGLAKFNSSLIIRTSLAKFDQGLAKCGSC